MDVWMKNRCVKVGLPNGKVADILSSVIDEMRTWIQDTEEKPESGGYIVGYQHKESENISLENISHPYSYDERNRVRFCIRDVHHELFLRKAKRQKSYYMGVWHTHPQRVPIPSDIDWEDWKATIREDRTGCQYVFFIIVGTNEWRAWVGDSLTGKITEVYECKKDSDGIYQGKAMQENVGSSEEA